MKVGSKGKEGMKEDPGFCLVHWMDDGHFDQGEGGESCKKSRFGRKMSYLISDTSFELSRGQANGAIQSTDECNAVNM